LILPPGQESIGIALPVREWSHYAEEAINSFISYSRSIDKLLVSVDGSETQRKLFSELVGQDDRIFLVQTSEPLSMAGHYEWCINQLETDWITVLGQDDALQFNFSQVALAAINFATARGMDAISFRRAYFNWNDGTSEFLGYGVKYATGGRPRRICSKYQLIRGLLGLVEHYDLPQIYTNNLVRRGTIEQIRSAQHGRVFLEPIPDTYSGVAVASGLGSYLRWPVPAFWTGTSNRSAGLLIASTNSVPPHIVLANSEGRYFGVSQEFWVQSQNSSIYILSALQTMKSTQEPDQKKSLLIISTAASVFATEWLRRFRRTPKNSQKQWLFDACTDTPLIGFSLITATLLGLVLIPLQAVAQTLRAIQLKLRILQKSGLRVMGTDLILSPNEANKILLQNTERGRV